MFELACCAHSALSFSWRCSCVARHLYKALPCQTNALSMCTSRSGLNLHNRGAINLVLPAGQQG